MVNFSGYSRELLPERINSGTLTEIPEICVNAFSNSASVEVNWEVSRAFFITHMDEDILKDFLNASFLKKLQGASEGTIRVYMHQVTYMGLMFWVSTEDSITNKAEQIERLTRLQRAEKICLVDKNVPFRLYFTGGHRYPDVGLTIEVTPLSSGHNPGSLMYLFEFISGPKMLPPLAPDAPREIILYTGNCRLSINDLRHFQPLYDFKGELKKITTIYLDTLHCAYHVKELPLRSQVEDQLMIAMANELLCAPNIIFEIWTPFRISCFNFLCTLSETFKERIHTITGIHDLFQCIPELATTTTNSGTNCRFHYLCAGWNQNHGCVDKHKDINLKYDVIHVTLQCDMFPSAVEPTEDELMFTAFKKSVYFKKPDLYHGVYSSNLSRFEMARIVNFLGVDPHVVKPLHRPKFMKTSHVRRLLRKTCQELKKKEHEEESSNEYPSRLYDFTGPNRAVENYYDQSRVVYVHMYADEMDPQDGAWGQGDFSPEVNVIPDSYVVPQLQEMDLSRLPRPRRIRSTSNHRKQTQTARESPSIPTRSASYHRPDSSR